MAKALKPTTLNLANKQHCDRLQDELNGQIPNLCPLASHIFRGEKTTVHIGEAPVYADKDGETFVQHRGLVYHDDLYDFDGGEIAADRYSGGDAPAAAVVPASKTVTDKLGSKRVFLLNADDAGGYGDNSPQRSLVGTDERLPLVSFQCLHQMMDSEFDSTMELLGEGRFKLLDYYPEDKKPLTTAQREQLKKAKRKYDNSEATEPRNYGLTPPALGYSLLRISHGNGYTHVWHRTGATLFEFKGAGGTDYFLFGQDEGTYFGCELAGPAKTLDEAFLKLMPDEARDRKDFLRQGEWFALPVNEKDVPSLENCVLMVDNGGDEFIYLPIITEDDNKHYLDCEEIRVSKNGVVYARKGCIRHNEHASLSLSGWHTFCRNTAKRSVSQEGVD